MHFTIYFLVFFLTSALAAPASPSPPPPPEKNKPVRTYKEGEIVGVKADAYESKLTRAQKNAIKIHPAVVVDPTHPTTGKLKVAMISKKLPNDPPQEPVKKFYHSTGLKGNIRLDPPKEIEKAKPWKHEDTGGRQSPMSHSDLQRLRDAMVPHQGWRTPTPPPANPPPNSKGKQKQGQRPRRPPQVNAHASSSRLSPPPVPPRSQRPPHLNAHGGSPIRPLPAVPQRGPQPPRFNPHASSSRIPVPNRGPSNQRAPSRPPPPRVQGPRQPSPQRIPAHPSLPPRPPPASHQVRPQVQGPRPPQTNRVFHPLPPRPATPPNQSTGGKGKQPMRGKREFFRRRFVPSEY